MGPTCEKSGNDVDPGFAKDNNEDNDVNAKGGDGVLVQISSLLSPSINSLMCLHVRCEGILFLLWYIYAGHVHEYTFPCR